MKIDKDVKVIRALLNISQQELAKEIDTSYEVINRWENASVDPEDSNINLLYSFAYKKKIFLNIIHEQMLKDIYNQQNEVVLFHGSKRGINEQLDLEHSKEVNDFGKGFYLGESFEQAATYIAYSKSHYIYSFLLNLSGLKIVEFNVEQEWMFAIAYYRGWLDKYKDHVRIKRIREKVENADIIIAPIADNKMFDLIDEFVTGMTTDLQCEKALSVTNLGFQYVAKTQNAINQLRKLSDMFLCDEEKDAYVNKRLETNKVGLDKVQIARIEYKNKGKYIKEILK
ncbi:MAG: DUF3990 domain-containing protein [Bacilli bacterium]|nr:DUF3990 domain-containing protein [Bacilli bacterium]